MVETANINELALFRVDDALYGIDISHIQEINKNLSFTKIYNEQDYIKGVLNLRGQIVTVIDLRVKFRRHASDEDPDRRVIIVKYKGESVGLLVDSTDDIIYVDPTRLEDSPAQIQGVNPAYFSGVYKLDDEVVVILDVEEILSNEEQYTSVA